MLPQLAAESCFLRPSSKLVTFRDNGHSMGSVHPPTLSDLSPLKVTGSYLSHEGKTIVQESGGEVCKNRKYWAQ